MASTTAPKSLRFLTSAHVQRLHAIFINPNPQLSQPHMLDSALQSPLNVHYYTGQEDVFQLAANLSDKVMKNHAFQDGNKRTALLAGDMFLRVNGLKLRTWALEGVERDGGCDGQSMAEVIVKVCTNKFTAEELGEVYRDVACVVGQEGGEKGGLRR